MKDDHVVSSYIAQDTSDTPVLMILIHCRIYRSSNYYNYSALVILWITTIYY